MNTGIILLHLCKEIVMETVEVPTYRIRQPVHSRKLLLEQPLHCRKLLLEQPLHCRDAAVRIVDRVPRVNNRKRKGPQGPPLWPPNRRTLHAFTVA